MEQAAAVVADHKEDVKGLEGQGLDHEEVSCPDGVGVVGEEGAPTLAGEVVGVEVFRLSQRGGLLVEDLDEPLEG